MRYGSLFSGIEAASVAWEPLGWKAQWFAEIEAFPSAVLAHHYPKVPNLGDVTKVEWEQYRGSIDVLVGGAPCQDFSIAGLRAGMAGTRGNLSLEFLRVLSATRPKWVVFENVPGLLSSNNGRDFGAFLGCLGQRGYEWSYRVLDAQYFGVPQRRRRVFVVGYLGDWRRAAAVLFERESLSWHSAPSRETRKDVTGTLSTRATAGGGLGTDFDLDGGLVAGTLMSSGAGMERPAGMASETDFLVAFSCKDDGADAGEQSPTLRAMNGSHENGGGQVAVAARAAVRRLTPVECERLMGLPDNWTAVPFRGKVVATDGYRYRAIGNSFVVPVIRWIGERIARVDAWNDGMSGGGEIGGQFYRDPLTVSENDGTLRFVRTRNERTFRMQATIPNHMQPWLVIRFTKSGPEVIYAGEFEAVAREMYAESEHACLQHRIVTGAGASELVSSEHK